MPDYPRGFRDRAGRRRGRLWWHVLPMLGLLAVAACGSPEEKEAEHLERGVAFYTEGNDAKAMIELRNVLRINAKNARAIYYVGLVHERARRWPQAFAAYQAATAEKPDFIEAHFKLGTLGLLSNNVDVAATAADAIEKAAPGHPDGLALKGAVALRRGDTQQALELAKTALAKDADHENGIAVYSGVLQRLGETQRAIETVDAAIARRPRNASLRLLKIGLLEQTKDTAAIRAAYDDLIAFDPTNEDYRLALANFLQSGNDVEAAERVLRQSVESDYGTARSTGFLVQLIRRSRGFEAADKELRRQIERSPDDHVLRFALAELNLQERRFDDAEKELRSIVDRVEEGGATQDAQAAIAQIALIREDDARAKRVADEVIGENGEHRGANYVRGLVALREKKFDDAVRFGRTALRRDPSWLPALKLVAESHFRRGEQDLAIGALNDVIALDPADAQAAQALATLLTQRGDYDTALKVWQLVIQHGSDKSQALRSRAQIAIQQKNWSAAQADINALLEIPEQQAMGALLAGNLMLAQNRFDQGREWFEKAQGIAPQAPEPVIGVVRTYLAQNKFDDAVAYLLQHTKANPNDAVAFNMLGELNTRQSRWQEAQAAFEKAIELQPTWPTPRRQLSAALANSGRVEEAIQVVRAAITAAPENADFANDLAGLLFMNGKAKEAITAYGRVIELQPNSDLAINNYAAIIADYNYDDDAALTKALDLASRFKTSSNPLLLDTLGWLYYRKGDYPVAATYLERAVNLAGNRADLRYHLGMALAKSGQKERAILELRRATATDVSPYFGIEEARTTLAQLEAEAQQSRPQQGALEQFQLDQKLL